MHATFFLKIFSSSYVFGFKDFSWFCADYHIFLETHYFFLWDILTVLNNPISLFWDMPYWNLKCNLVKKVWGNDFYNMNVVILGSWTRGKLFRKMVWQSKVFDRMLYVGDRSKGNRLRIVRKFFRYHKDKDLPFYTP